MVRVDDLQILGVITARGGSKGLPRKNVLPLAGKPLIAWTIAAARAARSLSRIILSTDDEEIADVGRRFDCEVPFLRPEDLAGDTSKQTDVVQHAIRMLTEKGSTFDAVVCLQPTTPLRTADHIDGAVEAFLKSGKNSLISVKEQDYPPWWMFTLDDQRIKPAFDFKQGVNVFDLQRQQFPVVYRPNGAVYVTWTKSLSETGQLVDINSCGYFIMSEECSISIDTAVHFATADVIARKTTGL